MTTRAKKSKSRKSVYLWHKSVSQSWIDKHENALRGEIGERFGVIEQLNRKRIQLEAAFDSRMEANRVATEFGGEIRKLPRNWLPRFTETKSKPLKIGKRLIVLRSSKKREAGSFPYRLTIPASAAFGTGEHATTAMSLRLLEQTTLGWKSGWSMIDLGTGSGILALAASKLGARRAIGIDNDPTAISVARENARLNKVDNVEFRIADVRSWKYPKKIDIVAANLFSELLIDIFSKLKCARRLILSGILREQERRVVRALQRNKIDILAVRRRGKWIAIAAALD
jgi:ribosomal protein L11 methyltransferase